MNKELELSTALAEGAKDFKEVCIAIAVLLNGIAQDRKDGKLFNEIEPYTPAIMPMFQAIEGIGNAVEITDVSEAEKDEIFDQVSDLVVGFNRADVDDLVDVARGAVSAWRFLSRRSSDDQ
jgi:hypothetical protein